MLDKEHATQFLQSVEQAGGKGIMLRDINAPYRGGRSSRLLKITSAHDAECTVIVHYPGKGKYQHFLGALTCKNEHGCFRIGSGFTHKGLPRFATYLHSY